MLRYPLGIIRVEFNVFQQLEYNTKANYHFRYSVLDQCTSNPGLHLGIFNAQKSIWFL